MQQWVEQLGGEGDDKDDIVKAQAKVPCLNYITRFP